jgi:hypothetical protein
MIPEGFPKWCTVYSYFAKWSEPDPQGLSPDFSQTLILGHV